MKCIIIYFSLTGNTQKIALAISRGVTPYVERSDLVTLNHANGRDLTRYDMIGLGSPVWAGVPPNVEGFLKGLPGFHDTHAFAFSTHGAKPELFFPRAVDLLTQRGLTVIGLRDWYGSVYLPNLPKPYFTDGHPDDIDLKEAEDFGQEMVSLSRKIRAGESAPTDLPAPLPPEAYISSRPRIKIHLNPNKCRYPECRLCMDHCPMKAIDFSVSPRAFGKGCQHCYFCEMICPTGAIEVDYESVLDKGLSRARRVFAPALASAQAQGRFRPLVPLSEIGWDTPFYKRHNAHPRYTPPACEEGNR